MDTNPIIEQWKSLCIDQDKTLEASVDELENLNADYEILKHINESLNTAFSSQRKEIQEKESILNLHMNQINMDVIGTKNMYSLLKKEAESKLRESELHMENTKKKYTSDLSILEVRCTRAESRVREVEMSLETKTKENTELIRICDELVHRLKKVTMEEERKTHLEH